jgi:hypothetical protein
VKKEKPNYFGQQNREKLWFEEDEDESESVSYQVRR